MASKEERMRHSERIKGRCLALLSMLSLLALLLTLATATVASAAVANGKIAFQSDRDGNDEIYVMNADGSGQTRLTNDSAHDRYPDWSPDGSQIAFQSDRDGNYEIYVMNANGSDQTNLTNASGTDAGPAWSPHGTQIAFSSWSGADTEIYVMNADGSGWTNLTNNSYFDGSPAWSPDGTQMAFNSGPIGNNEIYSMSSSGGRRPLNITNNSASDTSASWSPDGSRIAFQSNRDGNDEIYSMNANGSEQTRLTNNSAADSDPYWSPDGSKIAFSSNRDGNYEIYLMNADGSGPINLTNNTSDDSMPSWAAVNSPTNATLPTISGTSHVGQVLSCYPGSWNNNPTSYSYQWQRDGSAIPGATGSAYTLGAADAGSTISCSVTATNDAGSETSTSAVVRVPSPETPPSDTTAPVTTIDSGPRALVRKISAIFTFHANEIGVGFECRVDERPWGACGSPEIVYGLKAGGHTFQVRAQDWAGNTGETASWNWVVDRKAPKLKRSNLKKKKGKNGSGRLRRAHLTSFSGLVGDDDTDVKRVKVKLKIENPRKKSKKGMCASLSLKTGRRIVNKCSWGFTQVKGTQQWKISLSNKVRAGLKSKDHYCLLIRTLDSVGNHKIYRVKFRVL